MPLTVSEFGVVSEVRKCGPEPSCNSGGCQQSDILSSALDAADVRAINTCLVGKTFLSEPGRLATAQNGASEPEKFWQVG